MKAGAFLVAMMLASCGGTPTPEVTPVPSAPASGTVSPAATPTPDPGDIPWMSAQRTWDANETPLAEYGLVGGILGEDEPRIELQVPMAPMVDPYELGRAPAAGIGLDGSLAYAADDGTTSGIHLVSIADGTDALVAELPEVVWSLALAPDGATVFLLVMDRVSGADAGVLAVPAAGGEPVTVMGPADVVARGGPNVLAAVVAFQGTLVPSMDGRMLARRVCSWVDGPFGCALDVLDLATGEVRSFPAVFSEPVIGLGAGFLVTGGDCSLELCSTTVTDVASGVQRSFAGAFDGSSTTLLDGRLVLAEASRTFEPPTSSVSLTWPDTGERDVPLEASGETLFFIEPRQSWHAAVPLGWLLVEVSDPVATRLLAVSAADGSYVELTLPLVDFPRPSPVPAAL